MSRAIAIAEAPPLPTNWRASLRLGYLVLFLSVGVGGGWASFAHVDAAVVATGAFAVESNRKTVQHLEGGIVAQILVRDGDRVEAGQTLIRLDTTRIEAAAASSAKALAQALTTEARYTAQRDIKDYMVVPQEAQTLLRGYESDAIDDNYREFESRRQVMSGAIELVDAQIKQARNEIAQSQLDMQSASDQMSSIDRELSSVRPLLAKGLVAMSRVTSLERQKAQYEGQIKKARNDAIKGQDKIAELELRKEGVRKDYRQEASNSLLEIGRMVAGLRQERQIALDQLSRTEIRAPVAGTVQEMHVFTVGGVIRPSEPILDVVPISDALTVKAKITPADIDRIQEGMAVELHLGTLMKYRREKVTGRLRFVSRDIVTDTGRGAPPSYPIEVTIDPATLPEDVRPKLVAGMEATIIMPTQGRTVLQYLVAPVVENFQESLRER